VIYDEDLDGLESLRMVELTVDLSRLPWDRRLPILSAGSVRAIVTGEPIAAEGLTPIDIASVGQPGLFAYRNERAAAPAELATFWRFAASPAEARGMLVAKGFDPRRHAVLEGGGPPPSPGPCARPSVRTVEQTATSTTVQTDSPCTGVLVFSEPFSPGWDATVDGASAAIRPSNAAFSAVLVPAGRHEIRRVYRPRSLAAGALVCLATLLALAAGSRVARRA
jgi:hypothetical protein